MTDLETREDDWARGVFDRVRTGQDEPHWLPDATTAARLSDRRRTRYRMTGALAAVAIVGLSATAFTTLGGNVFQNHDAVSPAAGPSSWNSVDLTKYLEISGGWKSDRENGTGTLSKTGLTTISTVLQRIDPGLDHIRTTADRHQLDVGREPTHTTNIAIEANGFWAPDGDLSSYPRFSTTPLPKTPFGYVTITPMGPQVGQQVVMANKPCGLGTLGTSDLIPQPTTWSTCVRSQQPDGSFISVTHSVNLPAGTVTVASRVFPDGSSVQITASTVVGYTDKTTFVAGPPLNPVPWTDASLAQALTGPNIKGLS